MLYVDFMKNNEEDNNKPLIKECSIDFYKKLDDNSSFNFDYEKLKKQRKEKEDKSKSPSSKHMEVNFR